jgi:hypothetical protein
MQWLQHVAQQIIHRTAPAKILAQTPVRLPACSNPPCSVKTRVAELLANHDEGVSGN